MNLAFFTDGLMLERRDGITLDVAWRHLTLGTRRLLLADVPGHAELVRNMATGASTADAALLLVDAERGVQPQTRRHLVMLGGLGVTCVVVCINKMDAVGFAQAVATRLTLELDALARSLGIALEVIPISALEGDHIVRRGDRMAWYSGPTVAQRLESMQCVPAPSVARAVVQLDSDGDGWTSVHSLNGALEDELVAWPEQQRVRVLERSPLGAGRVRLESKLPRGTLLTPIDQPARVGSEVNVIVTWLGPSECISGLRLTVLQHGRRTGALVNGPLRRVSRKSGELEPATSFVPGDVGRVRLVLDAPTWFDAWNECAPSASALLIDSEGRTVAGARFV